MTSFLQSWFHQDFDLAGDTIEEIVSVYKKSAQPSEIAAVQTDMANFLAINTSQTAATFDELFDLDIDPLGFAPSVEAFLLSICRALASE